MSRPHPPLQPVSQLGEHQKQLKACRRCNDMVGPVVTGEPVASPMLLVGQAPGDKEGAAERPFAWTAGKTLFGWFSRLGLNEQQFRQRVYMSAVCRCFPGKNPKGGDRVPAKGEIEACSHWLQREIELLQPVLIVPVGKLAISQFIKVEKLTQVIGQIHPIELAAASCDLIPLPHPSGASTWHRTQPGKGLLQQALDLIARHRAWKALLEIDQTHNQENLHVGRDR
ncbi:MAG: uracil-DNA glycosylase family protein [Candidatus Thiodiazotropha sp.]